MTDQEKLSNFGGSNELVSFLETMTVKDGVECDVYSYNNDSSRDLAIVKVAPGAKTPLQKILSGQTTTEGHLSGKGTLKVTSPDGSSRVYDFDGQDKGEVVVMVGQTMQWAASPEGELVFYEICVPPYEDGRFENITE